MSSRVQLHQKTVPENSTKGASPTKKIEQYASPVVDDFDKKIVDQWVRAFRKLDGNEGWGGGGPDNDPRKIAERRAWGSRGFRAWIAPDRNDTNPIPPEQITPKAIGQVMSWLASMKDKDAIFWLGNCPSIDKFCRHYPKIRRAMRTKMMEQGIDPNAELCPVCEKPMEPVTQRDGLKPEYQDCHWRCMGRCDRMIHDHELEEA